MTRLLIFFMVLVFVAGVTVYAATFIEKDGIYYIFDVDGVTRTCLQFEKRMRPNTAYIGPRTALCFWPGGPKDGKECLQLSPANGYIDCKSNE